MQYTTRFTEADRQAAVDHAMELMEEGCSQNHACKAVAEDLGLNSPRTIAIWAIDLGRPLQNSVGARAKTKTELERLAYNQIARIELSDLAFAKAQELLPAITDPKELWQWTTAFNNLIESRRLEEGRANSRVGFETQNNDGEPRSLGELVNGQVIDQQVRRRPALPPGISPLARRPDDSGST